MDDDEFQGARSVERATRTELRALKVSVQKNALAATMVSLARQIDYARGATSAAMAAAQLRETRRVLMDEAAEHAAGDAVDELNDQHATLRVVGGGVAPPADLDGSAVGAKRRRAGKAPGGPGGAAS